MKNLILDIQKDIAILTLNRPDKSNALNAELITEFLSALQTIEKKPGIRILIIKANGNNFCAGADLKWFHTADLSDLKQLVELFARLNNLSAVTLCLVHGKVLGGGNGILSCCDIVIAENNSVFSFSEVKLGVIPATIAPYVLAAIGERAARRYFISAENISANEALRLQLVHEILPADKLENFANDLINKILQNGPQAVIAAKKFIRQCQKNNDDIHKAAVNLLAEIQSGAEAQEGLKAFLEKREPRW